MRKLMIIATLFFGLITSTTWAVTVNNINQATVVVSNRSGKVLQQALRGAFSQVLVKMSGNPYIITLPTIQNALPDLQQFVQSYGYLEQQGAQAEEPLQLRVIFDQSGMKRLLRSAGQAVWHRDRPLTLVTVSGTAVIENMNPTPLDTQTIQTTLQQAAKARGIPVIFPTMDLTDQNIVDQGATNTGLLSLAQLQKLGQRYGVLSGLAGDLTQLRDGSWKAKWLYEFNGQSFRWDVTGATQTAVIATVMNNMTNEMVNQLAVSDNKALQSTLTMDVVGVSNIADYAKVMHYLRQRDDVANVSVKNINATGMLLQVDITGNVSRFQQAVSDDGRLKVVPDDMHQDVRSANLYYYWVDPKATTEMATPIKNS